MVLIRSIIFTILIPGAVVGYIPYVLYHVSFTEFDIGLFRFLGITLFLVGLPIYGETVLAFLLKGGTPAIWFTRPLRFILGEEPGTLVADGIYKRSRNPMYLGVLLMVFGEALYFEKYILVVYALVCILFFHIVVVFIEEPHLKRKHGAEYERYLREVPRWIGTRNR
jgi:protein-S-isoprenylcysteine O-methyltransferase Ste14